MADIFYKEEDLLLMLSQGDEKAMKQLFDLYYPRLYYFSIKIIGNEAEAEDQAQEALLALWHDRKRFAHATIKQAEAFMITVVKNKAFNFLKHIKMRTDKHLEIAEQSKSSESENLLEANIIQEDIFYHIYKEIQALPSKENELLKMIYIDGLDTTEIARKLNTTPNNIRNQKARALAKLRLLLFSRGPALIIIFYFL